MECTQYDSKPPPPYTSFYLHGDVEMLCVNVALKEAIGASVRAHGA